MLKFKHKKGYCPWINIKGITYYLQDENKGKDIYGNTIYEYKFCCCKDRGRIISLPDHCAVINQIAGTNYLPNKIYPWNPQDKTGEEIAEYYLLYNLRCTEKEYYTPLPDNTEGIRKSYCCFLIDDNKQHWLWHRTIENELYKEKEIYKIKMKSQKHTIQKIYPVEIIYSSEPYKKAEADAIKYLKNKYGYQEFQETQIFTKQ